MAIQLRRGAYADFDPTKMVPAEVGIVTSGDPNTDDGKAAYVAFSAGNAKRLATVEDIATDLQEATDDAVGQATARAEAAAESVEASAAQITTNKNDIADLKADLNEVTEHSEKQYVYTPITYDSTNFDRIRQGIHFIQKTDGTVDVSGTNDGSGNSLLDLQDANGAHFFTLSASKTYRLTGCPAGGNDNSYYISIRKSTGGSLFIDYGSGVVFSPPDDDSYKIVISVIKNYAVSGTLTFNPLLEEQTIVYSGEMSAIDVFARKGYGLFDNTIVTPQMFGAKADGSTDDSQAVIDADAFGADAVFFPPGVYNVSEVTAHIPWIMADGAWITTTVVNKVVLTIAGNGNTYRLNCRFRNINPYWGIDVTGNNNHIEHLIVDGMVYDGNTQPYGSAALMLHGNNNTVDFARFIDFTQSHSGNDSAPQCIATLGTATGNYFADVYSENCRGTFINAAGAGTINSAGTIKTINAHDNGIYNVRGGHVDIGVLDHDGADEGFVVITDTGAVLSTAIVGTLVCRNCAVAIRIKNAGDIKIGQAFIEDCGLALRLDLNNEVSESLSIDDLHVSGKMLKVAYMSADGLRGVLNNLNIGKLCVTHSSAATGAAAADLQTYIDLSAVGKIDVGMCEVNFEATDSAYQNNNPIKVVLNSSPTKRSHLGQCTVSGAHNLLVSPIGQTLMEIKNGLITNNGAEITADGSYDSAIFADAAPNSGSWKKGQRIMSTGTDTAEYVCVASGTPGTWKSIPLT